MSATSRTISYNKLYTTTADKIHKSGAVQDAITTSNPFLKELTAKKRIKQDGGDQIRSAIMYAHNQTIDSYSGLEQFDISPQEFMTAFYVPWSHYGGAITIKGTDRVANMGKEKLIDLMAQEVKAIVNGWSERLAKDLWEVDNLQTTTSPYSANGGKNIIGVPIWVQPHTTSSIAAQFTNMDIGGINQSENTWWHNQLVDAGGSLANGRAFQKLIDHAMNLGSLYAGKGIDLAVCDQVTHEVIKDSLQDRVRYVPSEGGTPGFPDLYFNGAKLVWDGYVPDTETSGTNNGVLATGSALTKGSIFFLNTDTFTLYTGKDRDWKPRGFQNSINQDGSTSLYISDIQLVCDNRIKNVLMFDIPTALTA